MIFQGNVVLLITGLVLKKRIGREHILYILANMHIEADALNECIFLAGYDIRSAFDSGIYAQLLLAAHKRDVDRSVILPFPNRHSKISIRVKVPSRSGQIILRSSVPVRKGIRRDAISSPLLCNNSVLEI